MPWFKKTKTPIAQAPATAVRVPEGLWIKCPSCTQVIYNKDLQTSLQVCPKCSHHFRMTAGERLGSLLDGPWEEHDAGLSSNDPLNFTDTKPYRDRLRSSQSATGLLDAIIVGSGTLDGIPVIVAAMEYSFIGGSMGVVVGEKITRAIELQAPSDLLLKRLRDRVRDPEQQAHRLDPEYVKELNEAYQHFFFNYTATPLLIVETSQIDFGRSDEAVDDLLRQLRAMGRGTQYYVPRK